MERRRLWGERVERLRVERVDEKLWTLDGSCRAEMEVGKASGRGSSDPITSARSIWSPESHHLAVDETKERKEREIVAVERCVIAPKLRVFYKCRTESFLSI